MALMTSKREEGCERRGQRDRWMDASLVRREGVERSKVHVCVGVRWTKRESQCDIVNLLKTSKI